MYGPLDDGGVPEEFQFSRRASRGASVCLCDGGPCAFVVGDSIRGDGEWWPHWCCSEGNQGSRLDLFCTFKRV